MKNLIRNFILVIAIGIYSTNMSIASVDDPVISVVNADNVKAVDLHLTNLTKKNFVVQIKDQDGTLLLTKKVKSSSENIRQRYNLKNLPDGLYYMSVSNGLQKTVQGIRISKNQVIVEEGDSKKYFRPTISVTETSLDVNMLLLENKVSLIIQNETSDVVYATTFQDMTSINKRFNLSDLPKGKYSVIIRTKELTFIENIEL